MVAKNASRKKCFDPFGFPDCEHLVAEIPDYVVYGYVCTRSGEWKVPEDDECDDPTMGFEAEA